MTGAAAGCAQLGEPPLKRLYQSVAVPEDQPPLIVIPGAFGSKLRGRATGQEIWPRSGLALLFSSYPDVEVTIDPDTLDPVADDVEAFDIFRKGMGRDFYGALLSTLESIGGYQRAYPGQLAALPARPYYVYAYDWRLDNVAAVEGLHRLIEQVVEDHGDPSLRVDILAHSNGGLMARYYARFGTADMLTDLAPEPDWNGSHRIRRLLMVGTPNLGTMQPVLSHVRGEEIGLNNIPAEVVATCSGAPQLFPAPELTWLVNARGESVNLDVFALETWRELGWSIFNEKARDRATSKHGGGRRARAHLEVLERYLAKHLERGRRFQQALARPARPNEPDPFVFVGDCTPTVARLVLEKRSGVFVGREHPDRVAAPVRGVDYDSLINEPGDGVVTRASLTGQNGSPVVSRLNVSHSVFLCEEHQLLTSNLSFQDNLLYNLLTEFPQGAHV
jgi:pimeloyl-ACP methyl ester carboxylesterase